MHCLPHCIIAIRNRDDCEFMQSLYTTHEALMYRTALQITHDLTDADDAVSAVCESLIRNLERLKQVNPKVYPAYIRSAVRNQSLMFLRRRRIEQRAYEHLIEKNAIPEEMFEPDVDARLYYSHALTEVIEAICELPIDDQAILRMKFFDKLSDSEIAELLNIQPVSIRTKLSRARRRLQAALKEKEDDQ